MIPLLLWACLACRPAAPGDSPRAASPTDATADSSAEAPPSADRAGEPKLRVVATVAPLAFVARRLGGEWVEVAALLPPGRSAHAYEPTPGDLRGHREPDLWLQVGHPSYRLETRFEEVLGARTTLSLQRVAEEAGKTAEDPHLWLSPPALRALARATTEALIQRAPGARADLLAAEERFRDDLERAETIARSTLDGSACSTFLVDHPAWGAFATHFGLRQLALEAGGKAAGPKTLARVLEEAKAADLVHLFAAPGREESPAVRAAARELDATVVPLDPLAPDVLAGIEAAARAIAEDCREP